MLMNIALFFGGLALLILGAEWLVKGASKLAFRVGISPLVVGLTVVAFGTSAPELAINIQSALNNQADIALGNVVGSNIFNTLFILGLSALIIPLRVDRQLIRLDVPIMIGAGILLYLLALDGALGRIEGAILFALMIAYTIFIIYQSRKEQGEQADDSTHLVESRLISDHVLFQILLIIAGLVLLVFGARWLVDGAVAFARYFGVSELVIALTIIAAGTSMPEVATSIVAALRGERDIAVGNVVGSNIFNILSVLGITSILTPNALPISSAVLGFDLPIMLLITLLCFPIFFSGYEISRGEGGIFLLGYIAYSLYLILEATSSALLPHYTALMLYVALPITLLALAGIFFQMRKRRAG